MARAGAGRDQVVELADRAASDVGAEVVAQVVEEARVDDLETAALCVDRTAATAIVHTLGNALGVAVDEGDVLNDQLNAGVGVAVTRSGWVHLRLVARGHVEDAEFPAAAQRHLVAAVDDQLGPLVVEDLRRCGEDDRHRIRSTVEGDDAAVCDRSDESVARAARGSAGPDHRGRRRHVLGLGSGRDGRVAVRVARGRTVLRIRRGRAVAGRRRCIARPVVRVATRGDAKEQEQRSGQRDRSCRGHISFYHAASTGTFLTRRPARARRLRHTARAAASDRIRARAAIPCADTCCARPRTARSCAAPRPARPAHAPAGGARR